LNTEQSDLAEIVAGLKAPQKRISPKYFYDERGSQLFDDITRLPEYYLTDAELEIMQANVGEIADLIGPEASLIEFGSGSSMKTPVLLRSLHRLQQGGKFSAISSPFPGWFQLFCQDKTED
jgi:uncharacterized SAM-dependent methyltransferase